MRVDHWARRLREFRMGSDESEPSQSAQRFCTFCGKMEAFIDFLVVTKGSDSAICNECVATCVEIMTDHKARTAQEQKQ